MELIALIVFVVVSSTPLFRDHVDSIRMHGSEFPTECKEGSGRFDVVVNWHGYGIDLYLYPSRKLPTFLSTRTT